MKRIELTPEEAKTIEARVYNAGIDAATDYSISEISRITVEVINDRNRKPRG